VLAVRATWRRMTSLVSIRDPLCLASCSAYAAKTRITFSRGFTGRVYRRGPPKYDIGSLTVSIQL